MKLSEIVKIEEVNKGIVLHKEGLFFYLLVCKQENYTLQNVNDKQIIIKGKTVKRVLRNGKKKNCIG